MGLKTITTCLEQKILFATDLMNATKEIEVQVDENAALDALIERRKSLISRIEKCDNLIKVKLVELDETSDTSDILQILANEMVVDDCPSELLTIFKLSGEYLNLIQHTLDIDKRATEMLRKKQDEVRKYI